jgi:hypothetical protein
VDGWQLTLTKSFSPNVRQSELVPSMIAFGGEEVGCATQLMTINRLSTIGMTGESSLNEEKRVQWRDGLTGSSRIGDVMH